jgi:poly-gamma-glutamate synthesis protein (capsule biosynthesis protein)
MIYQQTFTFNTGELVSTSSKVIPCSMTTKPGLNDFQPKLLEGTEAERVLEKLKKRSEMIIFEVEMNKTQ